MTESTTHIIRILDQSGDTTLRYDPADEKAVHDVAVRFERLMSANFVAFDVGTHPGRIITAFDPEAAEIIVTPRFAGG
jgi:hypothetical protein